MKAHLFLIGYRGSGKSTLGRSLSDLLSLPLVDTDHLVESMAGKTIATIFAEAGEAGFRDLESAAIESVANQTHPQIVSLGGGSILRESNRSLIAASGWTAWLTASPETLASRIAGDPATQANRPALSKLGVLAEISSILEQRQPYYSQVANSTYNTDLLSLDELVNKVARDYQQWRSSTSQTD